MKRLELDMKANGEFGYMSKGLKKGNKNYVKTIVFQKVNFPSFACRSINVLGMMWF